MAVTIKNKALLKKIKPVKKAEPVKAEPVKITPTPVVDNSKAVIAAMGKHIDDLTVVVDKLINKPPVSVFADIQRDNKGKMQSITITEDR